MAHPTYYGIDVVALTFAVVLAAALIRPAALRTAAGCGWCGPTRAGKGRVGRATLDATKVRPPAVRCHALERLNIKLAILRQRDVNLQGQRRSTRSVHE